jgi:hypothetical protein
LKERKLEPHLTVTEILSTLIGSDLACKVISYEESYEMLCDEIRSEKLSAEQQQKLNVDILQLNTGKRISDELINAICEKKIRTLDDDHFIGKCPFAVRVVMDSFLSRLKSDPNIKHNLEDRLGSLNQTIPERWQKFIGEQKSEPEPVNELRETDGKLKSKNSFKPDGHDNWRITFMGKELGLVRDTDGMQYISIILNHSGRIRSENLYGFNKVDNSDRMKVIGEEFLEDVGGEKRISGIAFQHLGQETIDLSTINKVKERVRSLETELEQISLSDYIGNKELEEDKEDAEHELSKIKEYLRKNTRPDKNYGETVATSFKSDARKASGKIHHALKTACKNIGQESPDLKLHLEKSIKSKDNQFCYNQLEANLISWEVVLK